MRSLAASIDDDLHQPVVAWPFGTWRRSGCFRQRNGLVWIGFSDPGICAYKMMIDQPGAHGHRTSVAHVAILFVGICRQGFGENLSGMLAGLCDHRPKNIERPRGVGVQRPAMRLEQCIGIDDQPSRAFLAPLRNRRRAFHHRSCRLRRGPARLVDRGILDLRKPRKSEGQNRRGDASREQTSKSRIEVRSKLAPENLQLVSRGRSRHAATPAPLPHASRVVTRTAETLRPAPAPRGAPAPARSCPCGFAAPRRSTCLPAASRLPSCRAW